MSKALAFFPWVHVDEPTEIGKLRLIPYVRKKLPGVLPHAAQADIDAVLGAYATRPRKIVRSATLVEYGNWQLGTDVDGHVSRLFQAQALVTFAALAKRRFFQDHFNYTNSDTYALTVQKYAPGAGDTFAFTTRRRDGGTNQFWGSTEFAFAMPLHVLGDHKLALDVPLLQALLKLGPEQEHIIESINEFNAANTDAQGIPTYAELVMMKSAWEWLLQIAHKASDFQKALSSLVGAPADAFPSGPLTPKWRSRWPSSERLLDAWGREFCAERGKAAHGRGSSGPSVLPEQSHLLFSALLFPLAVQKVLANAGLLTLSPQVTWKLAHIDGFLSEDPMEVDVRKRGGAHPWNELDSRALWTGMDWSATITSLSSQTGDPPGEGTAAT